MPRVKQYERSVEAAGPQGNASDQYAGAMAVPDPEGLNQIQRAGSMGLEMTGLPQLRRGIQHTANSLVYADQPQYSADEAGAAIPDVAMGGMGVAGLFSGMGGDIAALPRMRSLNRFTDIINERPWPIQSANEGVDESEMFFGRPHLVSSNPEPVTRLPVNPARDIGPQGLPIASPQPFRNSFNGGSADLSEAAGMRGAGNDGGSRFNYVGDRVFNKGTPEEFGWRRYNIPLPNGRSASFSIGTDGSMQWGAPDVGGTPVGDGVRIMRGVRDALAYDADRFGIQRYTFQGTSDAHDSLYDFMSRDAGAHGFDVARGPEGFTLTRRAPQSPNVGQPLPESGHSAGSDGGLAPREMLDWIRSPYGQQELIRNPTPEDLNFLTRENLGNELKYVSDTQGNRYVFSASDTHHNGAMRALRENGVEVMSLGPGAEITNPDAAGFIFREPDGRFVHADANAHDTGPWADFVQRTRPATLLPSTNPPPTPPRSTLFSGIDPRAMPSTRQRVNNGGSEQAAPGSGTLQNNLPMRGPGGERRTEAFWDDRLTPSQNKVVEMARNGHTNAEIADEMETSINTVASQLSQAQRRAPDVRVPASNRSTINSHSDWTGAQLYELSKRGLTNAQIAERTGVPAGSLKVRLWQYRQSIGAPQIPPQFTPDEIQRIRDLRSQGATPHAIARTLNRSHGGVTGTMKRNNIASGIDPEQVLGWLAAGGYGAAVATAARPGMINLDDLPRRLPPPSQQPDRNTSRRRAASSFVGAY